MSDSPRTPAQRVDSLVSAVTKIGTALDQRESYEFRDRGALAPEECRILFSNNDLAAAICELPPTEALASGCALDTDDDDVDAALADRVGELQALEILEDTAVMARCYGDAWIYVVVDDGASSEAEPLDLARVQKVRFLRKVERQRINPVSYYMDPADQKHGKPETYIISAYRGLSTIVHETRLIPLFGARTCDQDLATNNWFHHSVLKRCYDVLRDFGITWSAASLLVSRSAQGKYKLKDLAEALAAPGEEAREAISQRVGLIDATRGSTTALILDADGEDFTYEVAPLTSLPELLDRFSHRLAAAAGGIPVTKLFGVAPGGLGNTGESDQNNWDRILRKYRTSHLQPALVRLGEILLAEMGREDLTCSVSWPQPGVLDPLQESQRRAALVASDVALVTAQILSPEMVARARFVRPDGYASEITLTEEDVAADATDVAELPESDA